MKGSRLKRKTPLRAKSYMKAGKGFSNKKSPRQRKILKADALIQAVVLKDKPKCIHCPRPATEGHHGIHRWHKVLRWDTRCVAPVCHDCHELDKHPKRKAELEASFI